MAGKVYKIIDNTNNNVYFGSTTKSLDERLRQHKYHYTYFLKTGNCSNIKCFEIIKNKDFCIELVEEVNDLENLKVRERFYIENNDCLNKNIPVLTQDEKKEKKKERAKIWREKNRDEINRKHREWRKAKKI